MTSDIESRLRNEAGASHGDGAENSLEWKAADEIAHLRAQLAQAKEGLRQAVKDMTCRSNSSHYCPNCDNTTFDARVHAENALAELEK